MFRLGSLIVFAAIGIRFASADEPVILDSPKGNCAVTVKIADGSPAWSVKYLGQRVIADSKLGLKLRERTEPLNVTRVKIVSNKTKNVKYDAPLGKNSPVILSYRETNIEFGDRNDRTLLLHFRVYENAVAFRYHAIASASGLTVEKELTEFNLPRGFQALFTTCKDFRTSHETEYAQSSVDQLPRRSLIDLPCLAFKDGLAASITEANLREFPAMYLSRVGETGKTNAAKSPDVELRVRLSPLHADKDAVSKHNASFNTPWRVLLLANHPGKLLESDVICDLNERPTVDATWVKPGKRLGIGGTAGPKMDSGSSPG